MTGCSPFNDIATDWSIIYKVIEGGRPNRPPSGFTDSFWELLTDNWLAEHGSQSQKRPHTSTVIDRLNKEVDNWGKSITPPREVGSADYDGKLVFRDGISHSGANRSVVRPEMALQPL